MGGGVASFQIAGARASIANGEVQQARANVVGCEVSQCGRRRRAEGSLSRVCVCGGVTLQVRGGSSAARNEDNTNNWPGRAARARVVARRRRWQWLSSLEGGRWVMMVKNACKAGGSPWNLVENSGTSNLPEATRWLYVWRWLISDGSGRRGEGYHESTATRVNRYSRRR